MKHLRLLCLLAVQFFALSLQAQSTTESMYPDNWYNMDLAKDNVFGVSTEQAYEVLKGKTSKTVIVAVIDAGTDVTHEDLKDVIWVNEDEIAGNGIDDDKNGYIDDVHGWNFIGGPKGNVVEDNYEMTRLYKRLHDKYGDKLPADIQPEEQSEYRKYMQVKADYQGQRQQAEATLEVMRNLQLAFDRVIRDNGGSDQVSESFLNNYSFANQWDSIVVVSLKKAKEQNNDSAVAELRKGIKEGLDYFEKQLKYYLNTDFDARKVVGDNYADANERYYGNNQVYAEHAEHGTHVAGIIAAVRNNGMGVNGIADNVRIMVLRVVPDGDERDKDVANAIRYAVDNGATVINMSFGKSYDHNKQVVDEAVRYAASKDVLLVHAAGNDGSNTDVKYNYPTPYFLGGKERAANWIEVGASTPFNNEKLAADFSNYGKEKVDVFAPGYQINSTMPESKYARQSGTSMASPVVAGVAALIRSYYPELTAEQVKEVITASVVPVKYKIILPGTEDSMTKLKKMCNTGGVVNAYQAVLAAEKLQGGQQAGR